MESLTTDSAVGTMAADSAISRTRCGRRSPWRTAGCFADKSEGLKLYLPPPGGCRGLAQVGVCANAAGTSHMRAAYHTAQATTKSDMTHTHTGIEERASACRGSNGSS